MVAAGSGRSVEESEGQHKKHVFCCKTVRIRAASGLSLPGTQPCCGIDPCEALSRAPRADAPEAQGYTAACSPTRCSQLVSSAETHVDSARWWERFCFECGLFETESLCVEDSQGSRQWLRDLFARVVHLELMQALCVEVEGPGCGSWMRHPSTQKSCKIVKSAVRRKNVS